MIRRGFQLKPSTDNFTVFVSLFLLNFNVILSCEHTMLILIRKFARAFLSTSVFRIADVYNDFITLLST